MENRPFERSDLWQQISAVDLDLEESTLPFSARLARDNAWTTEFSLRVIEEYRRFAYLIARNDCELTPSDEVDQAWHLHLCYTRHYWNEWQTALGKPLHHGPTKGGHDEGNRFIKNYEKTLALYEDEFGHAPPADIWPSSQERFRDPGRYKRLDTSKYIFFKRIGRGWIMMAASICLFLWGITYAAAHEGRTPGFLGLIDHELTTHPLSAMVSFVGIVVLIGLFVYYTFLEPDWAKRERKAREKNDGGCGGGGSGCGGCG